jgi:hypothetical protein
MAMLEDVLGQYDQSNFDIRSTAALIRQLGQQAGLSEEELAAAVPVFGDAHRAAFNSGYTEGSNYSAIARAAVSDALAARGADPSRFNQATQGFVDQGAQQAQQRWLETQKDTSFGSTGLGQLASAAGQALASYFGGPIGAAASSYALSGGDVGKAALSAGLTYAGGQLSGTGSGAPGGSWYSPSGDISSAANKLTSAFGGTDGYDLGGGLTVDQYGNVTGGTGINTGGSVDPSAGSGYDLGGGLTVDQYGNVTGGTGINTGGSVDPSFGGLEALSAANPGMYGMAAADAAAGAGAAGTGGTFGGLEALSAANPGTYGMAAADAAAGAAGAAAGAAGAGAAGTGMFQQLMAATGLSEKQLMGLGAAGISSLTSLYGASQIGKAASTAADIGAGATDRATALQQSQYDQTRADLAPYRAAGTNALAQLTAGTAPGGQFTKSFGMSDFEQDPGYGFRMSEGLKALDRSAAARGGLLSGATLKGAQRYGQDLGSQEYQNAFNRYQTNRSNLLNPLQSLAGIGQTSTNQGISAGQNYATNVGNLGMNAAGTQANAGLTAAQANQSAYGNVGNAFANYLTPNPMNEFFLNQLNKRPGQ